VNEYVGCSNHRRSAADADHEGQSQTPPGLPWTTPEAVPGVTELIDEGFEPIEHLTGAMWVVTVWPEEHRRSVPETRPGHEELQLQGLLWLVRSPWPGLSAADALSVVWANLSHNEAQWAGEARLILRWPPERLLTARRGRFPLPPRP